MDTARLMQNMADIRLRLEAAAAQGGHPVPTLVAVTKKVSDAAFLAAVGTGCAVAENYAQAFARRYDLLCGAMAPPPMHLVGSLQTNKVKLVVGKAALIHSLDSRRLAEAIERQAERVGVVQEVLLEVNSAREPNKGGLLPEDVRPLAEFVRGLPHIRLRGLMTMGKNDGIKEHFRPYFAQTRRLFEALLQSGLFEGEPILSMGMSDSFEIAAQEGATLVRVGTALFSGVDEPQKLPQG